MYKGAARLFGGIASEIGLRTGGKIIAKETRQEGGDAGVELLLDLAREKAGREAAEKANEVLSKKIVQTELANKVAEEAGEKYEEGK